MIPSVVVNQAIDVDRFDSSFDLRTEEIHQLSVEATSGAKSFAIFGVVEWDAFGHSVLRLFDESKKFGHRLNQESAERRKIKEP